MNDYLHKASRLIVDWCKDNQIGKNDGWKQAVNIGGRNNLYPGIGMSPLRPNIAML